MRDVLKIIHYFSLIANYDKLDKTVPFFKLLLILSIRKSTIKRDTFFYLMHRVKNPKIPIHLS